MSTAQDPGPPLLCTLKGASYGTSPDACRHTVKENRSARLFSYTNGVVGISALPSLLGHRQQNRKMAFMPYGFEPFVLKVLDFAHIGFSTTYQTGSMHPTVLTTGFGNREGKLGRGAQ